MSFVEAIVLGLVQGLTEFLPISSSGHLRIVPLLFGWSQDRGAAFTAVVQLGTLVAALAYFRRDILTIVRAWTVETFTIGRPRSHDAQLGWMIALGTIPIVVAGLALKKHIHGDFRRLTVIASSLIFFGLLMLAAERFQRRRVAQGHGLKSMETTTWADALWVGLAQALALVPGASRSGVTITASLFRGVERAAAARFSFLLSLPAVFLAAAKEMYDEQQKLLADSDQAVALLVATIVSGVVGYASIALLLRFLRTHTTYVFVAYRVALGALVLAMVFSGRLPDREVAPAPTGDSSSAAADAERRQLAARLDGILTPQFGGRARRLDLAPTHPARLAAFRAEHV